MKTFRFAKTAAMGFALAIATVPAAVSQEKPVLPPDLQGAKPLDAYFADVATLAPSFWAFVSGATIW